VILASDGPRREGLGLDPGAADVHRMLGQREERRVVGRVPVRPELGILEAPSGERLAHAAGLLAAAAVRPVETPREQPGRVPLEPRADDAVDAEESPERQEVGVEGGRREQDEMAELEVPAQPRGGVFAQPVCGHLVRELVAEEVDLRGVPTGQRGARKCLQPITVTADEGRNEGARTGGESGREAAPCGAAEEREHAVAGRERAVDVEGGDDRTSLGSGCGHGPARLYTRGVSDGPEIFDDLYLGLQAGGALRKQRRGEELTEEEREAIGRWQQMSMWRKGVAIGAFAVGTFGLGFTLGGLVFGRWARKA
jgi:hypothetical protein